MGLYEEEMMEYIDTIETRSLWQKFVDYCNIRPNKIITRQEIINDCAFKYQVKVIDSYRLYLMRTGYISRASIGKYILSCKIPITLSLTRCKKLAYPKIKGW